MSRVSLWVLHGRHFLYLKDNSSVSKNVCRMHEKACKEETKNHECPCEHV